MGSTWKTEAESQHHRLSWKPPFAVLLLLGLVVCVTTCGRGGKSAGDQGMSKAEADTLLQHYAKDRADTEEWLKSSPTSYLATVGRLDFGDRTSLTVGSGGGSDVRLNDPDVRPHHLRVTVVGDSFRVQALDPRSRFQAKDSAMTSATLPPSSIKVGRF